MLIDTHVHLDMKQFARDRDAVVTRAARAGVEMITVGIDLESSAQAVELAREYGIYAAVGIHPHEARRYHDDLGRTVGKLEELAGAAQVVALGEMGLDYYRNFSPHGAQVGVFRAQLELAGRLGLPVVVHNRQADGDVLSILENAPVRGVIHSFSSPLRIAERLLRMGFYLGFSGPLTFPQAIQRQVVQEVPLERVLVETDAPYLAPVPYRGKRNEPSYVRYVAQAIGELRGIALEEVEEQTTANARSLFALR